MARVFRSCLFHEIKGYRFGYFLVFLKGLACENFHEGDSRVQVLFLEDLCNRLPGLSVYVIYKETPSPFPDSFPKDGLPGLTWQPCTLVTLFYDLFLPISSFGVPSLTDSTLCLCVTHQPLMDTFLP